MNTERSGKRGVGGSSGETSGGGLRLRVGDLIDTSRMPRSALDWTLVVSGAQLISRVDD